MAERVRLIVLNYNGGDDLRRCVEHLTRLEWPTSALDLVVIDNASTDGSAEALRRSDLPVTVHQLDTNRGFPANNVGFVDLEGVDYVGLVNNDAFVEPGYLAPLVDALRADPRLGAACPKILLEPRFAARTVPTTPGERLAEAGAIPGPGWLVPDELRDPRPRAEGGEATVFSPTAAAAGSPSTVDLVNNVGNVVTPDWFGADRGLHQVDDGQFDEPVEVDAWCGAAVLFPRAYLEDVGGFDERLFLYYEDLDLAWRGRARGWRYRTVPTSIVRHRLAASSGVGSELFRYHVERNRLVVLAKNAPLAVAVVAPLRHAVATASYALRDVVAPLLRGRRPAPALVGIRLRALAGFLRLLPHALAERRRINRSASVPPSRRLSHQAADLQHSPAA